MKRIDQSIRQEIADLYASGKSSTELVKSTNISEGTILNIIREYGLQIRGSRVLEKEHYPKVLEDYRNGLGKRKISEKYRCTERTVVKILQAASEYERDMSESRQVYRIDQTYFDKIDTSEKAYFLGFLWADGHNQVKHNDVRIQIAEKDILLLEKFKRWLSSDHPILSSKRTCTLSKNKIERSYVRLTIKNKHLSQHLLALGMVQQKTSHPVWPNIEPEFERDFIRGFLDGDGCWYVREKSSHFVGSVSFAGNVSFLKQLAQKIEAYTNIKLGIYLSKGSASYGVASLGGRNQMIRFGQWLYQDKREAYLDRKYQKYLQTVTHE